MRWKSWALLLTLFVAGGTLGVGSLLLYHHLAAANAPDRTQPHPLGGVKRFGDTRPARTGQRTVALLGRLEPLGGVVEIGGLMNDRLGRLVWEREGRVQELEEGDLVKKGDVLGYLETYQEREAEWDGFKTQLQEAEARLEAETAYSNALIQEARVAVDQARDLDPFDVKVQEARVEAVKADLASARTELGRLQGFREPGAVSPQMLDRQGQLVKRNEAELASAEALLAKAQAGQGLNQRAAEARLKTAEAALARTRAAVPVESLKKNLALAEERLSRTVLSAPRDGRILKKLARPGERVDHKPILRMGDTSRMVAVAEVYETDLYDVRQGMRATITSAALPFALHGTVDQVGWNVSRNDLLHVDPAASADTRVVEVRVLLALLPEERANEMVARMTNLQVDVKIDLSSGSPSPEGSPPAGKSSRSPPAGKSSRSPPAGKSSGGSSAP